MRSSSYDKELDSSKSLDTFVLFLFGSLSVNFNHVLDVAQCERHFIEYSNARPLSRDFYSLIKL